MSDQFILACNVQPASGEPCPAGQGEWISSTVAPYADVRDMLFGAPPVADVAVVMSVAITLGIAFNLPQAAGRIVKSGLIGAGILSR